MLKFLARITPPAVFAILSFPGPGVGMWGEGDLIGFCLFGTVLWGGAAGV